MEEKLEPGRVREEERVRHVVRCVALLSLRLARRSGIHQVKSPAGWGEHILSTHAVCRFSFLFFSSHCFLCWSPYRSRDA